MKKNVSIYLADELHPEGISLLRSKFNVIDIKGYSNDILLKKIKSASKASKDAKAALLVRSVRTLDRKFIKQLPAANVKLICTVSAGFDNIDLDACKSCGIHAMNVAGANSTSAAEFTFAAILALAKNIVPADKDMKKYIFDHKRYNSFELAGKTIGIIGVGRIGSKVVRLAKAFNMIILANDINPAVKKRHTSLKFVSLNKLLSSSDIVTIHTPLDKSTRKLINSKNIKLLSKNSILINCSRGGTIDEPSLISALKSNKISYAVVDVFEKEPSFNKKFIKLNNVLLSPHLAGKTLESRLRMALEAAKKVTGYFYKSQSKHKLIN